ncbi:Cupin domain protein [Paraburkholderia terricola]|uniref:Cupin domain protein n=1 Tax=Paraburkholderia terricola TaxID=169427 RepID=A0A1M6T2F5_9BURK|nr:Cupin domain protein [Paraburkholderia terricola]
MTVAIAVLLSASFSTFAADIQGESITVARSGSQPSVPGGMQRFSGSVRIDPLFQSAAPSRLSGGLVTFEPGARTAWHTHPLGQTLLITSGRGWIQQWGHEKQEVVAGEVVSIPPGVKHWHGATSTTGMTHVALQEALDSKNVNWLEQVTDEQYRQP